ncbi:hypothetical protein FK531_18315 [Rhodococcus spelaei]|uniref:Uncharacterized protein n=1 Tax=Rhodococcus spelaei TaxID=2546320 RepID=A0A541B2A8_9NOCA|nr:hypothetical protein [Rhodococcus spelaei]TQF66451.1 hypothetical protein FK531_18315 [Rhodococcus spelaei]
MVAIESVRPAKSKRRTRRPISPKVTWSSTAGAVATIVWTVVVSVFPHSFTPSDVASLTGSTATVLVFLHGYWVPDKRRSGHRPRTGKRAIS